MHITELLPEERIRLRVPVRDRDAAIDLLTDLLAQTGGTKNRAALRAGILAREEQGSTAIGGGIAVPHVKSAAVDAPALAALTVPGGVGWGAPDGAPTDLIFLIAAPADGGETHLELLAQLMGMLLDPAFAQRLRDAERPAAFRAVIDGKEEDGRAAPAPGSGRSDGAPRIVAVTACPTGIAHTYLAAEALERAGQALSIPVKVETQGSGGAKHVLTPEEIAGAEAVLIAADREVDLSRFRGKPLLRVPVGEGIRRPEELLRLAPSAPVWQGGGPAAPPPDETAGRRFYQQLMNGVSHMLPFVIGGGILIALAFLLDDPALGYETFGTNRPIAAWCKAVGGTAFAFMLPVLAGYIALAIGDRPALMPGFVGGALAMSGATFAQPDGSGVSAGFLGALIAGFAAGWLVRLLQRLCGRLPKALEGIKPVLIYPVAGLLLTGLVLCAVDPVMGMLNDGLYAALSAMGRGSRILLGFTAAAMMAIDMGGPFNKAAYLFGTSTLAMADLSAGGSGVMAAVMAGGMVPPLAIALAVSLFPDRFSPAERRSGPVNYLMGLCFITEGAIPFAAADPLRTIPACAVGAGAAGALSMLFGCASPAPHGGIFVLPVMARRLAFFGAVAAGTAAGALLLALLKRSRPQTTHT